MLKRFIDIVESMYYLDLYKDRAVGPKTTFYRRLVKQGELKDFLIILPQPQTAKIHIEGIGERATIERDRRSGRGGKFGELTDPKHRPPLEHFISKDGNSPPPLEKLRAAGRGTALVYLIREPESDSLSMSPAKIAKNAPERGIVVAFSSYVPATALASDPAVIQFQVVDPSRAGSPIIDAPKPGGHGPAQI